LISQTLYLVLGFLSAALIAALIAPAFWRRAVRLTRERVVAAMPMTLEEIQAGKDAVRAEFAMATRRLELALKAQQDRAAAQAIELGRVREDLKAAAAARDERDATIKSLREAASALEADLTRRDARIEKLTAELSEAREQASRQAREMQMALGKLEEASLAASSRQVEIVAREHDIAGLRRVVETLEADRRTSDERFQGLEADLKAALDAARTERKKALELEEKLGRMYAVVADREETLERRAKDLAQLRETLSASVRTEGELNGRIAAALATQSRLEARLAESEQRFARARSDEAAEDPSGAFAGMAADRKRLEERLATLARQNQKLRADLSALEVKAAAAAGQGSPLREQMSQLAAEIVHLVEVLEGPQSPIRAIVPAEGGSATGGSAGTGQGAPPSLGEAPSLADRIRALRQAAAAR
jgi:chromosome segregation ATPase